VKNLDASGSATGSNRVKPANSEKPLTYVIGFFTGIAAARAFPDVFPAVLQNNSSAID